LGRRGIPSSQVLSGRRCFLPGAEHSPKDFGKTGAVLRKLVRWGPMALLSCQLDARTAHQVRRSLPVTQCSALEMLSEILGTGSGQ